MKVSIKDTVIIKEINARLIHVCITSWWVWQKYGLVPVITSANDGDHKGGGGRASLHYTNMAWDLRIWGLPDVEKAADDLRNMLNIKCLDGSSDYDVVVEPNHIHVEYDPKERQDGTVI